MIYFLIIQLKLIGKFNLLLKVQYRYINYFISSVEKKYAQLRCKNCEGLQCRGNRNQKTLYQFVQEKYQSQAFNEIVRYNIYVDGQFFVGDTENYRQQAETLKKNIEAIHPGKQVHIGSMGFLISSANHKTDQKYHVQYDDVRIRNLFIPLVPLNTSNSSQYLKIFPKQLEDVKQLRTLDQSQLLNFFKNDGILSLEIHSVVCDAFTVLDISQSTIHRGIANRSGKQRPMFFVNYSFDTHYRTPKAWFEKFLDTEKLKERVQ